MQQITKECYKENILLTIREFGQIFIYMSPRHNSMVPFIFQEIKRTILKGVYVISL